MGPLVPSSLPFIYARRSSQSDACDPICHEFAVNSVYGLLCSIDIAILILYGMEFILNYLGIINVKFALLEAKIQLVFNC